MSHKIVVRIIITQAKFSEKRVWHMVSFQQMLAINMLLEVRKQMDFLEVHIYLGMGNQYVVITRTRTQPTLRLVMSGCDEPVRQCTFLLSVQIQKVMAISFANPCLQYFCKRNKSNLDKKVERERPFGYFFLIVKVPISNNP